MKYNSSKSNWDAVNNDEDNNSDVVNNGNIPIENDKNVIGGNDPVEYDNTIGKDNLIEDGDAINSNNVPPLELVPRSYHHQHKHHHHHHHHHRHHHHHHLQQNDISEDEDETENDNDNHNDNHEDENLYLFDERDAEVEKEWTDHKVILSPRDHVPFTIETTCELIGYIYEQLFIEHQRHQMEHKRFLQRIAKDTQRQTTSKYKARKQSLLAEPSVFHEKSILEVARKVS